MTQRFKASATATVRGLLGSLLIVLFAPSVARAQDEVVYYHIDAIGSVRATTDAAGAVIGRYDYLPFGEPWAPPSSADVMRFVGKERDAETDLDYFGARYYRDVSGRFTTVDPVLNVEAALADPQRWNRYGYALNNPTRVVDPDGKEPVTIGLILWGIYEVGSSAYDGYTAYRTLRDPNATAAERSVATGGFLAGIMLPGGGYGAAGKAVVQRADDIAHAAQALRGADDAVRFHHAWPKYLGGAVQQILEPLPKAVHDAFHSGLDKLLPRQRGTKYYEALSAAARSQALKDLAAYARAFDAKYGTRLFEALRREGLPK
jgi:RHS repeat-associated protein